MLLFSLPSVVFPRGKQQATGQNCQAGTDPDKMDSMREGDVCIGVRMGGQTHIMSWRVKNKRRRVKSDDRKIGKKQCRNRWKRSPIY